MRRDLPSTPIKEPEMTRITIGGWKPLRLFPFVEAQSFEDRSEAAPGITLFSGRKYRLTAQPLRSLRDRLIAPRLEWTDADGGRELRSGDYLIVDATDPMESVYCYVAKGNVGTRGGYQRIAISHSLARAMRICERHAHHLAKK